MRFRVRALMLTCLCESVVYSKQLRKSTLKINLLLYNLSENGNN